MANCKFCGKEIHWMKEGRKNVPAEMDGAKHECEEGSKAFKSAKTIEVSSLTPEQIAEYEKGINDANEKWNKKKKPKS